MFSYLKKYPFSIIVVATVIYLSLFKPPKTPLNEIQNLDKLIHLCMYMGLSGIIWIEYLRNHSKSFNLKRILVGGALLPILFSGLIEIIQENCTTNRSGEWLDFAANSTGVLLAGLIGYYILRPKFQKK